MVYQSHDHETDHEVYLINAVLFLLREAREILLLREARDTVLLLREARDTVLISDRRHGHGHRRQQQQQQTRGLVKGVKKLKQEGSNETSPGISGISLNPDLGVLVDAS